MLVEIYMFVDKDQCTRRSELFVGACYLYSTRSGYRGIGAPKISLVNEVQCGAGIEWSDLIGQRTPAVCQAYGSLGVALKVHTSCS